MAGRTHAQDSYRFGYQGQEHDDEISGNGNAYSFEYRIHDSRLGRFFSIDPMYRKYPGNSSYAFSQNRVIDAVELEGCEAGYYGNKWLRSLTGGSIIQLKSAYAFIGSGYALAAVACSGIVYDKIGVTTFYGFQPYAVGINQNMEGGSDSPQVFFGGVAGIDESAAFSKDNYFEKVKSNMAFSATVVAKDGVGGGIIVGENTFGISVGVGGGYGFSVGSLTISQSISLTYDEADYYHTGDIFAVVNQKEVLDKDGVVTGYSGELMMPPSFKRAVLKFFGGGDKKNIQVYCGVKKSSDGVRADGAWKSSAYEKQENKLKKEQNETE